ncbi:MAG: DEAD/DEAH box helicase [Salibacteraceae bacterium]
MPFSRLGVASYLNKALANNNFQNPFPVQEEVIPEVLEGKDILAIAETGSGKTASYVLPIIMKAESWIEPKDRAINSLVLVPTRELGIQVQEVFKIFGTGLPFPFKTMVVHGGVSINPQMKALYKVNVLVATPGRLLELIEYNALSLKSVEILVLDEADKMLNMGFKKEMDQIFNLLPKKRQNLLFSATLSPSLEAINKIHLNNPETIKVEPKEANIDLINQITYRVSLENKGPLLRHLIKEKEMDQVLIFTSSVHQADKVTKKLIGNGFKAAAIHSKKSQGSRFDSLTKFKNKNINILVATDLLSRGIDIEFLPFVINYELPRSPKDFVHRIGRTGRAENPGEAITFITPDDMHHFKVIQKKMKKRVSLIEASDIGF